MGHGVVKKMNIEHQMENDEDLFIICGNLRNLRMRLGD